MNPRFPISERDLDPLEVNSLIDRFARAKWITGLNVNHPDFLHLELTELGRERMRQLGEVAQPFAACASEGAPRPSIIAWLRFLFRIRRVARGLQPPPLSQREVDTLIGMAALHYRKSG